MFRVGIIGAGSISVEHIRTYIANKECEVVAIADINIELAKKRAEEYKIETVYSDYHEILNDKEIDAVSIATPTFTHKQMLIEAIESGKHILCEKPPALNATELKECAELAKGYDKCIMFALAARFWNEIKFLKEYVDSGKMGKILCAEAVRMHRCDSTKGWFLSKSKSGGGPLIDANIHEIDQALYLMGYPKPKTVMGFTSDFNKDLPSKIKSFNSGWVSADENTYERDVENVASAYITFENGSYLFIKTSTVLNTVTEGTYIEISGEKAGARVAPLHPGEEIKMVDCIDDSYIREFTPVLDRADPYQEEIDHFVDCCINGTKCICKMEEAILLMEIIDAIYESARTGEPVRF